MTRLQGLSKSSWILVGLWLLLLPMFGYWLWRDRMIAPWDMSIHALISYEAWRCLTRGEFYRIFILSNYYPYLFHVIAAPFTVFGSHPDVYCGGNWVILLAAMIGTLKLGRVVAGEGVGLAAGLLLPAYIYVTWMGRMPLIDLALTATVVWTVWLLARGETLENRAQRHGLGIVIALGLLAKWPYLFFVSFPMAIYFWKELKRIYQGEGGDVPLRYLAPVAVWPAALAGIWYLQAFPNLVLQTGRHFRELGPMKGDPAGLTQQSMMYYLKFMYLEYFTIPLLMLLAAGALRLMIDMRARGGAAIRPWIIPLAALVGGYLILTLIGSKDSRYIMPLMPIFALISVSWLSGTGSRRHASLATVLIGLLTLGTVVWNLFVFHPPDEREWKLEAVADWIVANKTADDPFRVGVIQNEWTFNTSALNYALLRRDRAAKAWRVRDINDSQRLSYFHYAVGLDPPPAANPLDLLGESNAKWFAKNPEWTVVESFAQEDGTRLLIYERRKESEIVQPLDASEDQGVSE